MTREKKYPNTDTFFYYNANPKNRITGDCVARAITTASGQDYNALIMDMALYQCVTGYDATYGTGRYLDQKGWEKHPQPRKSDGTKYTGKEFCEMLNRNNADFGNIVANIGGNHMVCIKKVLGKYKVHDIWNSTEGYIGNWWTFDRK